MNAKSISAQIAASTRWANESDRAKATEPARRGRRAKLEREVLAEHPDLSPAEVEYRVDHLMRAHMLRMTLAAKKAREAKRKGAAQ